jgi:hypothetical protein
MYTRRKKRRKAMTSISKRLSFGLFLSAVLVLAIVGNAEDRDILMFENGDALHGRLDSAAPGKGVVWNREDTGSPITFELENIAQVKMSGGGGQSGGSSSFRLTNDDVIRADMVSLDGTNLVVKTLQAGKLTINRLMLASITPGRKIAAAGFTGPNSKEEWTITPPESWTLKKNALYSKGSGTFGREMNLPDMASIEMEVAWKTHYPEFRFSFYTDTITSYSGNNYCMRPSSSYIRLYRSGSSSGMPHAMFNFTGKRKAHFQLLVNKKNKSTTLLMDGQMVTTWTDPNSFAGGGTGIALYAYSNPLKVSNIRVSNWDGTIPRAPSKGSDTKEDVIELINGDKITGDLLSINDDNVSFGTSYATLKIPFDRVVKVFMSSDKAERARRYAEDVRVHFHSGGTMTLKLDRIEKGKVTGISENFDQASFGLDSVQLVDLNIYRDREDEDDEGW